MIAGEIECRIANKVYDLNCSIGRDSLTKLGSALRMGFRGRNHFLLAFAVVFHLAVIAGIFHAFWSYLPSVGAPDVNLEGSVHRPRIVRTIAISPALPSGSDIKNNRIVPGDPVLTEDEFGNFGWHPHIPPPLRIIK